jgi:hypothetical protein
MTTQTTDRVTPKRPNSGKRVSRRKSLPSVTARYLHDCTFTLKIILKVKLIDKLSTGIKKPATIMARARFTSYE